MPRQQNQCPVHLTVDVEDHGSSADTPRFREALRPLLTMLRETNVKATFFVVGQLAAEWATELRELAADGHEVGLHGHTHEFLAKLGPRRFTDELAVGRDAIARVVGAPPAGFRAPYFGLTRQTPWAPDAIKSAGFTYSSSVLPVWNPQAGYPGAPKHPFKWSNGLVEFPSPVLAIGRVGLPVLGGAYLRLVPSMVVKFAERVTRGKGRWLYAHPYDFDVDEPFNRSAGHSLIVTKLLFARRGRMLERVRLLAGSEANTLGQLAEDDAFVDQMPLFTPIAHRS